MGVVMSRIRDAYSAASMVPTSLTPSAGVPVAA